MAEEHQTDPMHKYEDPERTEFVAGNVSTTSQDWRRAPAQFHPIAICISGAQRGARLRLTKRETIIGRSRTADFRISDPGASRHHCAIIYENHDHPKDVPVCYLEDMGSRNGTELNGKIAEARCRLVERDRITIGRTVIGFFLRDQQELLQEESLYEQATKDALTGLDNRRQFTTFTKHYFERVLRRDGALSILLVDADHFKKVNDTYGHLVGDEVLRHMARVLVHGCRASDLVARWGGEEIAIALPETDLEKASSLADRLRRAIEESEVETGEHRVKFTISIGGTSAREGDTLDTIFQRADANLYAAKEAGRNRCEVT